MHDAHEFLRSPTVVLVVAAATTVLFQRLRQPGVLGCLIAGLVVGPHVPVPVVADPAIVRTLAELGVILLVFSLGLEFSLPKLLRIGPAARLTAAIQCSAMTWLGFVVGRAFGWTPLESLFTGALIAVSSTTIIAKVFDEQRVGGRLREFVVGILLVEDLIAVVMMAGLTAVASGAGLDGRALAATLGRLSGFLALLLAVGMLSVPRAMRAVVRLERSETTLVAAIFFVAVGMLLDPVLAWRQRPAVVALTAAILLGKALSVGVGGFLTGNGTRLSLRAGPSLGQIGEFSFIIAALGLSLGATGAFLFPVAVSVVTTLLTPWLVRSSEPVAAALDRRLPHRLQALASLYGTWWERRRATLATRGAAARRIVRLLALDAGLLAALVIGTSLGQRELAGALERGIGIPARWARVAVVGGAALGALPLVLGIGRTAHRLGRVVAREALPVAGEGVDLGAAPRRAFELTVQLGAALAAGVVVAAATQPFVPL